MSAIEFLMNGGEQPTISGDLPNQERILCNDFIKKFGEEVTKLKYSHKIYVSQLSIFKTNLLIIIKNISHYHFIFVDKTGSNQIRYEILFKDREVPIDELIEVINIELGEVRWVTSIALETIANITDDEIKTLASEYIDDIRKPKKQETEKNQIMQLLSLK